MTKNLQNKVVLSTVENFKDITNSENPTNGTLALVRNGETFFIDWCPLDGSPTQSITAVFDYLKAPEKDVWEPGESFCIDCTKLSALIFKENPLQVTLTRERQNPSIFEVDKGELIALTIFIEQLLINGIAIPSIIERYSLEFYKNGHRNTYHFTPAHIQLKARQFSSLEELWTNVLHFFEKLMVHLDASGTMPQDPAYPISTAARTTHLRVIEKINEFIKNIPQYEDITKENFSEAFDENGKLKDPEEFRLRLFHANKDDSLLPELIPFAVGVYPYDSTQEEREKINEQMAKEFHYIEEQLDSLSKYQINNNDKITAAFRIIDHDVTRTDRGITAFKNADSPGLTMLTKLLRMYALYNPPISYLQGMNDLFVPFILTFIPRWSEEGIPLDADGNELDYKSLMPMIFWGFDSMLINTNQVELLESVTEHCAEMAEEIHSILFKCSPLAAIWMKRNSLQALLWCYSDFVLMFKRSFENIWPTWIQFNTAPNPRKFLVHFITAMIICAFDQFSILPDVSITAMMDAFPKILSTLDADHLGKVALWVSKEFPPTEEDKENEEISRKKKEDIEKDLTKFEFFHCF